MKKKSWLLGIAILLAAGTTAALFTLSHSPKPQPSMGQHNGSAITFKVAREQLSNTIELKGKSSYQKETYVNAPFSGDVQAWGASEGAQVNKGDILFQLDDTALNDEIAQLQANQKKNDMDIQIAEFQKNTTGALSSPADGLSEIEAKQRYAQEKTREMQTEINRLSHEHIQSQLTQKLDKRKSASFKAPESGIFLFQDTKEPQSVKENERIGKIVDLTKLQLIGYIGEYDLFHIKPGMPVAVKVDALKNTTLEGKVEKLSKFAKSKDEKDTSPAQFEVVVSLPPNEQLIAGLSLTATIETDKKPDALVVSTLAIQRDKDQYYVMVSEGGQTAPVRRDIKIGLETPDKTEILSGLNEGDTVILQ
ncbi:efflux RND transporter periplasmic adaptor subunit [Paenibacillus piri]|uniref:Efflux RND transporter periplasmic adaptor subunit n=1 Tax=Paenibacillus piri TaxID=2547395 RepID=A0A4R5KJW3_9BACL|nr:efflux RND transporter periplasmic adaptor subunit [Paenibacillus piri]TDF95839.1 efflux RND transporter periplasmic adaptor subunit [Paenibacillus piri]